jgi:uncharacterized repeat protein (TIGR01451 family)
MSSTVCARHRGRTRRARSKVPSFRPVLERLENRITPSILGTFELDGNVTTGVLGSSGSTTTSHDWDQVFANNSGALASTFVTDKVNSTSDDIFTGGGSKDTQGIQNWLFKAGKPQGKDDISHAYAAAYTDPGNGHLLLYAGLDRFDNSGDSTAGFWFFNNQIGQNPNVTTNGGHPFTGQHANGDILLISNFTIGGSVSTIAVYEWVGNDSTGSLQFVGGNASNTFAIVNSAPISVPWSYTNKAGQTQPQAGEFLEEGVDLTALGLQGCFSTFLAETRSSQSPTATLSDLVTGRFNLCSLGSPPPVPGLSKVGDTFTYQLTLTNTGGMPLFIQSVTDTLLGNIVVNHTLQAPVAPVTSITSAFNFSTPLASGASLTILVTRPVQATDPDPTLSTTTYVGTDDLAGLADPITVSVNNTVNLFQPSATLSETASPTAGTVGTSITYTYTVHNTSSSDSPNLVLDLSNINDSFSSTLFGNIEADAIHAATGSGSATVASILPGASFSFTETHVISTSDLPGPINDSSVAHFTLAQNLGTFANIIFTNTAVAPVVHVVGANVGIAPNATNAVGQPHTFTVTVNQVIDGVSSADAGANVTVTLTSINGANAVPSTPLTGTTNGSGQFQVTFSSATAGQVIGNATATLSVLGVILTRATGDSNVGDSGSATKTFVDERISIAPNATNAVGQPHTFTATVLENLGDGNGFVVPVANQLVTVSLTSINGANAVPSTPLSGNTNASGQFQVTFTSATAGQVIGNATTSFTVNNVTETRSTGDSQSGDSGPANKTFVDERISIAPNATNAVGQPHTFTVTVLENLGDGNGFVVAVANQAVTVTLTNTNGASYTQFDSVPLVLSGTTNSSGQFSVEFTSATAGQVIGNATTSFTVNSVTETRSTGDSQSGDSGPATKTFEDERIGIAPNATNAVGQPHTFTVTVLENLGDGNGFVVPVANQAVTVTLTNTNGSTTSPTTFNLTTNGSGQAAVTFTSATAGTVIGNASTSFTVNGATETRSTGDSQSGDSGPVTKIFEDAQISIAPNATNGIAEPHTFTVTVMQNAGDGKGFVAAANDPVTVTLTGQNGAVPILESPSLSGVTNASGQFQVTFTSDSAGQVIGNASTTFTLNGVTLIRATGDGKGEVGFVDSGPVTKTFVAGKILWKKVDGSGNLLGGATFLVTATGGTAATLSPMSVLVADNSSLDANPANGLFELDAFQSFGGSNLTGLALGTYTIQEITPPPGYTLDPKVLTVTLTQSALTGDLTGTPFVDVLPNLNIVKTVTANQTVIHPGGTASFTITVSNSGAGTANNVVLTDNLPDASQLTWTVTSFTGFTSSSISSIGVLTAGEASMPGGGSASVVVSAAVPLNFFGNTGAANGDAVPSNLFEIDGNATVDTAGGHDWNQVFADNTANPHTNTAGAIASSFVTDETTGDDIYTGGSTKDTLPLSGWLFKTGKPQDKDELLHAYAAQYVDPSTHDVILYTGTDRFSNNGDSTMGFWFFVNPVSKSTNGTVGGSGANFVGTHTTGDILLISNFTVGGSQSTIAVYEWVGNDTTGGLQFIGQTSSTVAVVNNGNPGLAWPYMDKSGFTQPQPGEFIEEGVNLSGLGLNGCFSSFLAETRSSQSTTATLSDFILGSFQTCDVMLPNQASVSASNFNNGQPITSNTVIIDLNDGMPQMAASVNSAGTVNSLSTAQLQPVLGQAVAAWRAAGADSSALSNVANYAIHIAKLPDGELGWEVPGQIWIDPTAQGWGWSTGSIPAAGQMDLLTVLSHEVGHVLGYSSHTSGNDIMTTALEAGVRRLPEATTSTAAVGGVLPGGPGVPAGATANVALTGFPTTMLDVAPTRGTLSAPSHTEVATAGIAAAVDSQRSLSRILLNGGQQTAPSPAGTAVAGDQDASDFLVPGLWPASPGEEDSDIRALPSDPAEDEAPVAGQQARDAYFAGDHWRDALLEEESTLAWNQARDAYFAGSDQPTESGMPERAWGSEGPGLEAAAVALAVWLDGFRDVQRPETNPRKRLRML